MACHPKVTQQDISQEDPCTFQWPSNFIEIDRRHTENSRRQTPGGRRQAEDARRYTAYERRQLTDVRRQMQDYKVADKIGRIVYCGRNKKIEGQMEVSGNRTVDA